MATEIINPANGVITGVYETMTPAEVNDIIEAVHDQWLSWKNTSFNERANLLHQAADILRQDKEELASLMTREMGKVKKEGISEIEKCAWVCDYYADQAEAFLRPQPEATDASKSYATFQPLGVILAVMPWNFPFWQVMRFAAPALMAGNAGVLKHASNVPGCAQAIEQVFERAGFPKNVFKTLLIGSDQVNDVITHPRVKAVTLTGSTPAGKAVASKAGEVLKKTVLELGGSDPYIILEDADLEKAVEICVNSRLINSGQSCIAAKRFIVIDSIKSDFEMLMVEKMKSKVVGDPTQEDTDIGPLARQDLRDDLHQQVVKSIEAGAKCLLGGEIPSGEGAYYPATILSDVTPGMPAYEEELFGPVATIIGASNQDEAVRIANDTSFGLGAAVFSRDIKRAEKIAATEIEAGCCFVNSLVKSDPRLPFGGIKESGYGRELGTYGIKEFVNIKTVYIH